MPLAPPLAIFGSLAISEIVLIGAVALMVFGGRLPEVVMRGAAQLMRARKVVTRMWREAGLEQELRRVQWEIERNMPREADVDLRLPSSRPVKAPVRPAGSLVSGDVHSDPHTGVHDEVADEVDRDEERRDPAIDFGAPSGTVSARAPVEERRAPDPAPRVPDLPPRDSEAPASPPATPPPPAGTDPSRAPHERT